MNRLAAVFVFLTAAAAVAAFAAPPEGRMPPGKWWQRSEVVQRLQLTREQQQRLEDVFRQNATVLVDLKADVEKRGIELRNELDSTEPERQNVQRAAARLNEARGRLFERELMMLLDMRAVLTPEQWGRMREVLERQQGPRDRMQPPRRRPGPGGIDGNGHAPRRRPH